MSKLKTIQEEHGDEVLKSFVEKGLRNRNIYVKENGVYINNNSIVGIKAYALLDCLRNYFRMTIVDERWKNGAPLYNGMYC